MDDLLKDAIADAKAVRETAIANAKLALEEAFTPKLQNMLSQKIQTEMDDEDEMETEGEHEDEEVAEMEDDEVPAEEGSMYRDGDEEVEEEEGEMHDDEMEADGDDEMGEGDDDELDLEAIIRELEAEINEEDDEEERNEGEERDEKDEVKEEDEDGEDKDDVKENDVSSGIGKSDNAHDKKSGDSSGIGSAGKAKHESVDEEFDLDSILEALKEEDEEEEGKDKEVDEVAGLRAELDETREAVKFMRDKLNEVNLLNAKLLFTNKLFRAYGLNNEQKMKVVETFDRASNIREVKLVYSTMAETFGGAKKNEIQESKGSASKAVASTKSEKQSEVISEGNALRNRFKKLANII